MSQQIIEGEDQYPIYYPVEPRPLQLSGQNSGAAGAFAKLSFAFPTAVHLVYGLRISNYYPLPEGADADAVAVWQACRRYVDNDQTIALDISQQSIFVGNTVQSHVVGQDGFYWHPFPTPFVIAGGNNFGITVTRLTAYPDLIIDQENVPILPMVGATLVCAVFRGDMATRPPMRRG